MRFAYWVLFAVGVFIFGIAAGLMFPELIGRLLAGQISSLQGLASSLGPFKISTAVFIFFKNISSVCLSFVFAPLLLLFPLAVLSVNGALLGYIAVVAAQQKSIGFVFAAIAPHGVIELPAIIIGEAAGLAFGIICITTLFSDRQRQVFGQDVVKQLKILALACAMLVPAALVETFITPLFVVG